MRILTARFHVLVTGLLLIAPALAAPAWAQTPRQSPPPAGTPKNFTLPKPMRFTLPNGLAVTMVPFGQVPKVAFRLVLDAGNLYEGADQVWLADLTGRMLEEGTRARAADALARELAGMGGELAVSVGPDTASITTEVLADRGAAGARLVAEVAREPRLPQEALARVKAGLLRDLAIQKSTPQAVAGERFAALIYGDHPYGRTFPTEAMLGGYTLEQVQAFHHARFGPNRARLYVAGVFDQPALEAAIRDAFGSWERVESPAAPPPPARQPRGFALLDRPGRAAIHAPPRGSRSRRVEPGCHSHERDELAARRVIRLARHVEHSRAEGVRLLAVQLHQQQSQDGALGADCGRDHRKHRRLARGDQEGDRAPPDRASGARRARGHPEEYGRHLRGP